MPTALGAEILALSTADRLQLVIRLLDANELPEIALLILDGVCVDVMKRCIAREATWTEEAHIETHRAVVVD